ncbi:ATP-binding protein [Nostocaceae cyanobacterium CENA369]|uniref:ATP-binding protein n=1 Tax=Dendronalium phyllosphericum CENA369 TaxID=1725256 RepID=A0A8J7LFN3_9NOST|nr:ATP-binding protein [Dendronalium phyllosphericum]MBH8574258.1 ATP-binding protein [Dendronalium phyllosphericum CENA369]
MASIDDIIKREVNPFDLITIRPTNFWDEKQDSALTVDSIHQEAITEIEGILDLVATDHRSRSILLVGDAGSGKSHLLGRLKHTLNPKAFFAYILCDWFDSSNIWRHILRYTIDSLIQVPERQQESQLMIWLKSLSAFTKRNIKQRIFNDSIWNLLQSDRQQFIRHLKDTYKQARIYNPDIFFGILHDLTNPELYPLACEWLKGDELSEESMQILKVKSCIDTEDSAKSILANFGRISTETQPIVLCFDNLDTMPKLLDGLLELQPFLDVNTTIHGENLKNFLVIISVITQTLNRNEKQIQQADRARIDKSVKLKDITLEQAEALWTYLLKSLHQKAEPQPKLQIFPLTQQLLQENFPGGKTKPRTVLYLGKQEYQKYKYSLLKNNKVVILPPPKPEKELPVNPGTIKVKIEKVDYIEPPIINEKEREQAEFQLIWQQEYKKVQDKIAKISLLAASELIRMVQEALEALQVQAIKPKLISGVYASYSLSYQQPGKRENVGIVWTEDANMNSFYNVMNACQKAIQKNLCQTLYLIRIGSIGNAKLAGNKIYSQIFTSTKHIHIKPNLSSVHYLATYHSLVNSAVAQELVIAGKTITLQKLQSLIRESKILDKCTLLQYLGIVPKQKNAGNDGNGKEDLRPVKDFLLNLIKTQGFMGVPTLIKQSAEQFPSVKESDVKLLIELLCQEKKVKLINPKDKLQDQLICLVA